MAQKIEIEVVITSAFEKTAKKIWPRKTPEQLAEEIAKNWFSADIMKEPLVKLRLGYANVGKRSGARVILCYFDSKNRAYALFAYKKKDMDNLTKAQERKLLEVAEQIERTLDDE